MKTSQVVSVVRTNTAEVMPCGILRAVEGRGDGSVREWVGVGLDGIDGCWIDQIGEEGAGDCSDGRVEAKPVMGS
jgi:hypothetical protein